jgi:hypothetical protein
MKLNRPNFLLVDFENTQELDFEKLKQYNISVVIFAGPNQKTVPIEWLNARNNSELEVEVIKTARFGSNYLDIQIAAFAGATSQRVKDAFFHVLSRDSDFDSLIDWLKARGHPASRCESFKDLQFLKVVEADAPEEVDLLSRMKLHISNLKTARPRKIKTLRAVLANAVGAGCDPSKIDLLIEDFKKSGYISVGPNESVSYK